MIWRFEQAQRLPTRTHVVSDAAGELGGGTTERYFSAHFVLRGKTYEIESEPGLVAGVYEDGAKLGSIRQDMVVTKKVLFLKTGYAFFDVSIRGTRYTVYEAALGANRHFYCLYQGDQTVGVLHKDDMVVNYCDTYTLYAEEDASMLALCIFCMYLEATFYFDTGSGLGNTRENLAHYTPQKELLEKYDPSFIPRVLTMEEQSE